jgi:hypothetical protein
VGPVLGKRFFLLLIELPAAASVGRVTAVATWLSI